MNLQSGEPFNYYDSFDDISGTGWLLDRWNFFGKPSDILVLHFKLKASS